MYMYMYIMYNATTMTMHTPMTMHTLRCFASHDNFQFKSRLKLTLILSRFSKATLFFCGTLVFLLKLMLLERHRVEAFESVKICETAFHTVFLCRLLEYRW